jgi:Exostosin family
MPIHRTRIVIQSCTSVNNSNNHDNKNNDRTFWLSFAGSSQRHIRKKLAQLDTTTTTMTTRGKRRHRHGSVIPSNGNHTILITDTKRLHKRYQNLTYTDLLKQSKFAAVPRGDNLYSYRFTEVLAAGAIPVLFANPDWVLPFRTELAIGMPVSSVSMMSILPIRYRSYKATLLNHHHHRNDQYSCWQSIL